MWVWFCTGLQHECELFLTCEEWSYMQSQVEFHCKELQKDIWLHGNTKYNLDYLAMGVQKRINVQLP